MSAAVEACIAHFVAFHGDCCASCVWWHYINSATGECHRSAPVSGEERHGMLGMKSVSLAMPAGHVITKRGHRCGDFERKAFLYQMSGLRMDERTP